MTSNSSLTFPVTTEMHDRAAKFAQRVSQYPEKYDRVYSNTIAVSFMHDYLLNFWGVETNLADSESWDLASRLTLDVADLVIPNVGTIECRIISKGAKSCSIPSDVWENRVGYIVLEVDPDQTEVQLLGFSPSLDKTCPEILSINTLQPIDSFIDVIEAATSTSLQEAFQTSVTKLSGWLKGKFTEGWQVVSEDLQELINPVGSSQTNQPEQVQQTQDNANSPVYIVTTTRQFPDPRTVTSKQSHLQPHLSAMKAVIDPNPPGNDPEEQKLYLTRLIPDLDIQRRLLDKLSKAFPTWSDSEYRIYLISHTEVLRRDHPEWDDRKIYEYLFNQLQIDQTPPD
jgi:hypothetical protein